MAVEGDVGGIDSQAEQRLILHFAERAVDKGHGHFAERVAGERDILAGENQADISVVNRIAMGQIHTDGSVRTRVDRVTLYGETGGVVGEGNLEGPADAADDEGVLDVGDGVAGDVG